MPRTARKTAPVIPPNVVGVVWPDGHVSTAPTWEALEDVIRLDQFDIPDADKFREHMEKRAKNWSGVEIQTNGSANDFFYELERALLCERIGDGIRPVDPTPRPAKVIDLELYRTGGRLPEPPADETES